jgi:hypothetical protein
MSPFCPYWIAAVTTFVAVVPVIVVLAVDDVLAVVVLVAARAGVVRLTAAIAATVSPNATGR